MNVCNLDIEIFRSINGLAGRSAMLDIFGIFLASGLIFVMAAAVLGLAWYRYRTARTRKSRKSAELDIAVLLRSILAAIMAVCGNFLFSLLYFRERPFVALTNVTRLIGDPMTGKSLPSDHASMAFAIAVSVVMLHPAMGAVLLLAALGVAFGRVFVGVHFPTDVLAGMFVGTLAALAARYIGRRLHDVEFVKEEIALLRKMKRKIR
jgi:undecaprenyl-diphosphatase